MISIAFRVKPEDADRAIADLYEAGTAGITEEGDVIRAFFEDDTCLANMRERIGAFEVHFEEERDWVAESQAAWQPFAVGERWYLTPEWRDDPAPCGRIRLRTRPGMACGTGAHPATQLCLRALERATVEPDHRVLDIGTGSGILAEAARLLGAEHVVACDIEHAASLVAQANFSKGIFSIPVFTGSARAVRSGSIDLAVANLNAITLRQLWPELQRIRSAGSRLIVSGFRDDERVTSEKPREELEQDGWACQVF